MPWLSKVLAEANQPIVDEIKKLREQITLVFAVPPSKMREKRG